MYFRLHIHKLRRSITRNAFVSKTNNIISCDAPTPQAVVFVTYFHYLIRSDRIWNRVQAPQAQPGYPAAKPGNAALLFANSDLKDKFKLISRLDSRALPAVNVLGLLNFLLIT